MTTQTKKVIVTFLKKTARIRPAPTFFQLARKSIVKKKKFSDKHLSQQVDKIVYGI